jgi:hypothetical protein
MVGERMDVFELRERLVADYRDYTKSFIKVRDPRICDFVDGVLGKGAVWPEPTPERRRSCRVTAEEASNAIRPLAEAIRVGECARSGPA